MSDPPLSRTIEFAYLDEENNVTVTTDVMLWTEHFERGERNQVALDKVGERTISTVFLGVPLREKLYFETMSFPDHLIMGRYATWDKALAGHNHRVAALRGAEDGET